MLQKNQFNFLYIPKINFLSISKCPSKERPNGSLFLFQNNSVGRFTSFKLNSDNGNWEENKPLNYLGFEFYGYQTLLKSAKIGRFYRRMKSSNKTRLKYTYLSFLLSFYFDFCKDFLSFENISKSYNNKCNGMYFNALN